MSSIYGRDTKKDKALKFELVDKLDIRVPYYIKYNNETGEIVDIRYTTMRKASFHFDDEGERLPMWRMELTKYTIMTPVDYLCHYGLCSGRLADAGYGKGCTRKYCKNKTVRYIKEIQDLDLWTDEYKLT